MADKNEKIFIEVDIDTDKVQRDLSNAIESVALLKQEQKMLRSEIEKGNDVNGKYAKLLTECTADLEKAQRQVKSQTALMQASTAQALKQNASLDEQRQYLEQLQKAYANLEGEAKELADKEGGLRDQIGALTESVKEQEHAIGQDGRNVGNYAESIKKAAGQLGPMKGILEGVAGGSTAASKAIDGTDKIMKGMISNPWFGTIFLLGGILGTIADKLKDNKEAMQGVEKLTAGIGGGIKALEPILNWLTKFLVDNLLKAINWVIDAIKKTLSWIDKAAKYFGKELHLADAFNEAAEAAVYMTEEEKKAAEEAAKIEKKKAEELEKLREDMKRRRLDDMEKEIYDLEKKKEEELKMQKLTDDEFIEIENYYLAEIEKVRKKYADDEAKKKADAEKKKKDELEKEKKAEEEKLKARKEARLKFGLDPDNPEIAELDLLEQARKNDLVNAEEYELAKTLIAEKYSKKRQDKIDEEVKKATKLYEDSVKGAASSTAAAMSALSALLGEYAESSEEAAKAQKAFALGSILINQAMSVAEGAKGIAAAMAGAAEAAAATGPAAPIMLAVYEAQMVGQVLAVVASVASTIVQAKQLFDQGKDAGKYATGGIVPGTSYSGDKMTAHVNSGEMVLTQNQQARLFDLANGGPAGFAYEAMAGAIAAGMAAAPAPQLALVELADAQERVTTYNEIASI